ncbi:MAG: hypothetical protein AB1792_02320 [Candidatus Zixiibacteriota bacterium]
MDWPKRIPLTAALAATVTVAGSEVSPPTDHSVVADGSARVSPFFRTAGTPPPLAPGLHFANTFWDLQHYHSSGYQTARWAGAERVHFAWMEMDPYIGEPEGPDWFVAYTRYNMNTASWEYPFGGVILSLGVHARAKSPNLAADDDDLAHLAFHQRAEAGAPYTSWHVFVPLPGLTLPIDDELPTTPEFGQVIWPQIDVQSRTEPRWDIYHVVSATAANDELMPTDWTPRIYVYWRYDGTVWQGPVAIDSGHTLGYVLAADPNSDKVAIALHSDHPEDGLNGLRNVAYYESQSEGAGWISGAELGSTHKNLITNYDDSLGPQAWVHISTAYDHDGTLHVIWDEQPCRGATRQVAIRHWNDMRWTISRVALGYWDNPAADGGFDLNLAKMTLGIGDGATPCQSGAETNRDYLYVVYTRFGGPTPAEQEDHSVLGYMNGELYLNVSRDGGQSWSQPQNLTNTKTPNCNPGATPPGMINPPRPDSVCRSEHWATIGKVAHDIDIFFISDNDAGAIQFGEGTWQLNPVMYMRLPGGTTDAPYLCPRIEPWLASALGDGGPCGFHPGWTGIDSTTLTIANLGNGALDGSVSVVYVDPPDPSSNWLSVAGAQSLPITIPAGGDDLVLPVVMNAAGLATDSNTAEIRIAHNDTTQSNPFIIPVVFAPGPCRCHADPICDGQTSILDVVGIVNRAFRGGPVVIDSGCPHNPPAIDGRSDVDCSSRSDIVDVVKMIDVAFRGANPASRFCDPCL